MSKITSRIGHKLGSRFIGAIQVAFTRIPPTLNETDVVFRRVFFCTLISYQSTNSIIDNSLVNSNIR